MDEALLELGKIGKNNPINALVQLASTLNPKSLVIIVEKLEMLRDSLAGALEDNQAAVEE